MGGVETGGEAGSIVDRHALGVLEAVGAGDDDLVADLQAGDDLDGADAGGAELDRAAHGDAAVHDVGDAAAALLRRRDRAATSARCGFSSISDARVTRWFWRRPGGCLPSKRTRASTWLLTTSGEIADSLPAAVIARRCAIFAPACRGPGRRRSSPAPSSSTSSARQVDHASSAARWRPPWCGRRPAACRSMPSTGARTVSSSTRRCSSATTSALAIELAALGAAAPGRRPRPSSAEACRRCLPRISAVLQRVLGAQASRSAAMAPAS